MARIDGPGSKEESYARGKRKALADCWIRLACCWAQLAILGVSAFTEMGEHAMLVLVPAAIVAFTVFHAGMFSKLVGKHAGRIEAMEEDRVPFWRFFDAKGYLIMAFMMTMGIGLRSSGIAPTWSSHSSMLVLASRWLFLAAAS